ncbi:MAG TPA: endonuclease III [Thermoanaerobaculia bacterium]|nr:endonuclease III [Thermoanaerobaculia bacterium]
MPPTRSGAFEPATEKSVAAIVTGLHELHPEADVELEHESPLQLLVATILSAQSTDKRVNEVTRTLFQKYRTAQDFAGADPEVFQREIHSTGFFNQKTRSVLGAARAIVERHGGEVPQTMEELVELPGVARKTANVVLGTAFRKPVGFVVDTHVKRLAYRLGLSDQTDPVKVERDLIARLPMREWIFLGHALIWHGRRVCHARRPDCERCGLARVCPRNGVATVPVPA